MKIEKELNKQNIVSKNIVETFDCRFMGKINTFDYEINGKKGRKAVLHKGVGGANIIPVDSKGNIILETQYRFPLRGVLLETPAGRGEEEETFLETAKRELVEETGHDTEKIEEQLVFYADPNFSDEEIGCLIAKNVKYVGDQKLDKDENVKLYKVSLDVAKELIKQNIIHEERTIISIAHAILFGNIDVKEDANKEKTIEDIRNIIKKDEDALKEIETGIAYSYDCEFGNVTDYNMITSNNQVAKRECMSLKPLNMVIPVSVEGKIGVKVKYLIGVDKNSIELDCVEYGKLGNSLKNFGNFYTSVGYANSMCNIWIDENKKETDEYIWLSKEEILNLIQKNKFINGVVLAVLLKYLLIY